MLLGSSVDRVMDPSGFKESPAVWVFKAAEVRVEASAELQPERRPARRPARPREAILKRLRLVRETGRKDMSKAPGDAWWCMN
jgi:hypothetical protein